MSIFQKEPGCTIYFDSIMIEDCPFDLAVTVRDRRGDPSAIHCGRIVVFEMRCEDELCAYFDDGQWYINPEVNPFDERFGEKAEMAKEYFISKWSNPERIKVKEEAPF